MQRVFDNLLKNAINYGYPDSKIHIYLDKNGEKGMRLIVQNHGQTIPAEKLSYLFEQFFRLDSSRDSQTGGTGLGLAIAKQIVELHGGTIKAKSTTEHTDFTVILPYVDATVRNEDINIDMISQTAPQGSTQDVSFTTHSSELLKVLQVMSRIREKYSQLKLMVTTGNCKIQLYGEEMREMSGVAAKVMTTLLSKGIEIIMITTSEIDISLIVSPANQQQAVAELECAFSVTAE